MFGIDVVIMFGLVYVLVIELLVDCVFFGRYCIGYECFECYLLGLDDGIFKIFEWVVVLFGFVVGDL